MQHNTHKSAGWTLISTVSLFFAAAGFGVSLAIRSACQRRRYVQGKVRRMPWTRWKRQHRNGAKNEGPRPAVARRTETNR